jgi:N-acetylated-alpha-linked acidic dipeptidase
MMAAAVASLTLCALLGLQAPQQAPPVRVLPADAYAKTLVDAVSASELRRYHDLIAMEPHVAGTVGDVRQIERIRQAFEAMNLATRVERFRCLLCRPISASLEIVDDGAEPAAAAPSQRRGVVSLPIGERNLLEDPATAHPDLTYGWNAYSGNGDVTAPAVYANYATREDFAKLKELGVDVKGKIVIARYGKCFRGYKARFAQEAGAAGLIIYTDPGDSGFTKGKVWPQGGGWANDLCIQRGTLNTLPYPGDPGTPGVFSSDSVVRDDPAKLDLPTIPVQPIGYAAAGQILARFKGAEAPETWRGGLELPYRLQSGDGWKVRLAVKQERFIGISANVIATLPGAVRPDESVVIGCHHDAWGYGSADPGAGTMCLLEAARCVADLALRGTMPARSIVFAAWGAEEFGIIGSTEWVEAHDAEMRKSAVAYVNLDMAAMGPNPGMSLSPDLDPVVRSAAAMVPAAGEPSETVLARMQRLSEGRPLFGPLGGGSDHISFVCRLGIPSVSMGAGGSAGTSYHSNYDTVNWYRAVVGDDYASARMVTQTTLALAALATDAPFTPARVEAVGRMGLNQLEALEKRTKDPLMLEQLRRLRPGFQSILVRGEAIDRALDATGELTSQNDTRVRSGMRRFQQAFIDTKGLDGRPWFWSLLAASDRDDGYAACMLPLLSEAITDADLGRLESATERMLSAQRAAGDALTQIEIGLGVHRGG